MVAAERLCQGRSLAQTGPKGRVGCGGWVHGGGGRGAEGLRYSPLSSGDWGVGG